MKILLLIVLSMVVHCEKLKTTTQTLDQNRVENKGQLTALSQATVNSENKGQMTTNHELQLQLANEAKAQAAAQVQYQKVEYKTQANT